MKDSSVRKTGLSNLVSLTEPFVHFYRTAVNIYKSNPTTMTLFHVLESTAYSIVFLITMMILMHSDILGN